MNWYYAVAGQQQGPVPQEQFDQLVAQGVVNDTTLVWHEGLAAWQPWSAVKPPPPVSLPESAPPVVDSGIPAGHVRCSECSQLFPVEETILLGGSPVCASCKPRYFQRLTEGAAPAPVVGSGVTVAELLARDYDTDIGAYLERAWEGFKANAGMLIAGGVLSYAIMGAVGIVFGVMSLLIPFCNIVLTPLVQVPLVAGLLVYYLSSVRKRTLDIAMLFQGFKFQWVNLMLSGLIKMVPGLLMLVPLALFVFGFAFLSGGFRPNAAPNPIFSLTSAGAIAAAVGFFLVAIVASTYLAISWAFSSLLILDKGMQCWPAMELSRKVAGRHFWKILLTFIVIGAIGSVGVFACFFGLLVSAPVAVLMYCHLYEDVFGDLEPQRR